MVKTGQESIPQFRFRRPDSDLGVEVVEWTDLWHREPVGLTHHHRANFHQLLIVEAGSVIHTVDFVEYKVNPNVLLWVKPDQVHRFGAEPPREGRVVLFRADFPAPDVRVRALLDRPSESAARELDEAGRVTIGHAVATLQEAAVPDVDIIGVEVARHLLTVLLLRLAAAPSAEGPPVPAAALDLYARFQDELERSFATTRRAEVYAANLGFSLKTLNRACRLSVGKSAKQAIADRVVLEAKRLLTHTDLSVAQVSYSLGFDEPTNFNKFFTRRVGRTPGEFRKAPRADASDGADPAPGRLGGGHVG